MAWDTLDRVPLIVERKALCSKRHTLVEFHVVSDNACGTNDHSGAMVDGEMRTDGGRGMDIDARLAMSHLGNDAGDKGHAQEKQLVSDAVVGDSLYHGIAADYLPDGLGSRVALVGSFDVRSQHRTQGRQAPDKGGGNLGRTLLLHIAARRQAARGLYLACQQCVQAFDTHTDVIDECLNADVRLPVKTREEYLTTEFHNLCQNRARRQGGTVVTLMAETI